MKNITITAVPEPYKRAAVRERQGTVHEVNYPVRHYINPSRQLVTDRRIDAEEAGRETVEGREIVKTCSVYLPAGYDAADPDTRYNVMYLLHGVGGDHREWLIGDGKEDERSVLCSIVDNLIADGQIEPLILVFPNGRSAHDWTDRSFNAEGTNMLGFYYFDYELRYDLMPFIESTYNTFADIRDATSAGIARNRMHRAVAGLSMGGMQCLNLVLGGYRCDAASYAGTDGGWKNGLAATVRAPGMTDLFAYVGAFSNAPTSSSGDVLGGSIAAGGHRLHLLHMTCGVEDGVSASSYANAIEGLAEHAGDRLGAFDQVLILGGVHDFNVWHNGAYNFLRSAFGKVEANGTSIGKTTLPGY